MVGLLLLLALWSVRPIFHGFAMFFYKSPLVWFPPLLVLGLGAVAMRFTGGAATRPAGRPLDPRDEVLDLRARRGRFSWRERVLAGERPSGGVTVTLALAFATFMVCSLLNEPLTARSMYNNTSFAQIPSLPAGGVPRLVPRDVAVQITSSGFNSPTEHLTDFRIVRTVKGLAWTALRTPNTALRQLTKKSEGIVTLDAQQTERRVTSSDARFETAPGLQLTDNLRWRLLKKHYLVDLTDPVAILDRRGRPLILAPYITYEGLLVRRPVLGGAFVVHPDGEIEDLSPEQARQRAEIAGSGRLFPEQLARRIQDSYAYKRGIWNRFFLHEEQTQITDTEVNRQPYMIDFGSRGAKWVTVAEPFGRAFAVNSIFLTDTVTGETAIWRVPRGLDLSGNRRAIQTVRSAAIPGIVFAGGADPARPSAGGGFRVVEPRPVFVAGRLVYLISIVPEQANSVTKSVIVDAARNKVVAIFDHDSDPQADARAIRYLATGEIPADATPTGEAAPAEEKTPTATPRQDTPGDGRPLTRREIERRIDGIVERQRELLREAEELERALSRR